MRLNVCVNEMVLFGSFAAVIKVCLRLTAMAQHEVCLRDERAIPPGIQCSPLRDMDFVEGFVSFRTLGGMQSSPLVFAPNCAVEYGPQAPGKALCFWFALV